MKINGIKEANILGLSLANFVPSGKLQNPYSQTCITNILWPKLCMAAYASKARDVQVGGQSELKREILSQKIKVIVLIKIEHWEHFVLFYRSVVGGGCSWLSDPSPTFQHY